MSHFDVKTIMLNNGIELPAVGIGTSMSSGELLRRTLSSALKNGYRHFDCAHVYGNESEIGEVLSQKFLNHEFRRNELFIASKLGVSCLHPDVVKTELDVTLKNLRMDYLDLYYVHWPFALKYDGPINNFPATPDGCPIFDENVDYVETWKEMEKFYHSGQVKAIGVSNFNISQLKRLLQSCEVPPVVHQFECHPYLNQAEMIEFCQKHRITPVAFSPLCCKDKKRPLHSVDLFNDSIVTSLAHKYERTVAQICLRYQIQRGVSVIPRSTNGERMKENISVFDFCLSDEDVAAISGMDKNVRLYYPDKFAKHKHFPF